MEKINKPDMSNVFSMKDFIRRINEKDGEDLETIVDKSALETAETICEKINEDVHKMTETVVGSYKLNEEDEFMLLDSYYGRVIYHILISRKEVVDTSGFKQLLDEIMEDIDK